MRISLSNRLALVFFGVTLVAIGALYAYVAPGLQHRLVRSRVGELASDAMRYSAPIAATASSADPVAEVQDKVNNAALRSGARVTLMSVATAVAPGGPQLSPLADSSNVGPSGTLGPGTPRQAIRTKALATGVEQSAGGALAEAAEPVLFDGQIVRVIVFFVAGLRRGPQRRGDPPRHHCRGRDRARAGARSADTSWRARSPARVKRLELGAKRIAAGDFGEPIPVDSTRRAGAAGGGLQRHAADS